MKNETRKMIKKKINSTVLVAAALLLGFSVPAIADTVQDGVTAYTNGDYTTALRILQPRADQGDWVAQMLIQNINKSIPHHAILETGPASHALVEFYKVAPTILKNLNSKESIVAFEKERDLLEFAYEKESEKGEAIKLKDRPAAKALFDFDDKSETIIDKIKTIPDAPSRDSLLEMHSQQRAALLALAIIEEKTQNAKSEAHLPPPSFDDYRDTESNIRMYEIEQKQQALEKSQRELDIKEETDFIYGGIK